jgi:hypothetical protein
VGNRHPVFTATTFLPLGSRAGTLPAATVVSSLRSLVFLSLSSLIS